MCSNCSGDYEDPEATNGEPAEPIEAEEPVPSWPSPLLRGPDGQKRKPLTESFDELETI